MLHPGDQIAFEQHRFLLEAPGLPPRGTATFAPAPRAGMGTTQTMQAVQAPLAEPASAPAPATQTESRFNYWWLLGAAAIIAAVFVGIMLYAPR